MACLSQTLFKLNVIKSKFYAPLWRSLYTSTVLWQDKSSPVWKIGRLNHVAVAAPNLQKSISLYRNVFGADVSEPSSSVEHGVTVVFVNLDNTKIELLKPFGDKSPIENFLKKYKDGGIHHICLEVNDIKAAMRDLKEKGIRCLAAEPSIGAHGKPIVFLHPKDCDGILVELEEV